MAGTEGAEDRTPAAGGAEPASPQAAGSAGTGGGRATATLPPSALPGGGRRRAAALERGSPVGRYLVLERIGAGGMGVVYAGYDPELDRKVALKLLHPEGDGSAAGEPRLLREAQAIARLSHPNVVAVFDVGTLEGEVFLAMELVAGETLRSWLAARKRPWSEILRVFRAAGEGVAAAHAAGLAHRDFKPENVLIGEDGGVKVVDFGLARALASGAPAETGGAGRPAAAPPGGEGGSEWGAAAGTPAYMAPEQRRGLPADARSDQYSFCAALWEALYGVLPAPPAGAPAARGGAALRSPWGRGAGPAPAWLREVLERGLAASPEARFPSFRALLAALDRDPRARRRRWLLAAACGAGLAVAAAGFWLLRQWRSGLCGGGEAEIARAWNPERRAALRSAFAATGLPYARQSAELAVAALDRYAGEWVVRHRSVCAATRLRGEQSEEMLDRRMLCLGQRRDELAALASVLGRAEGPTVARASTAVSSLGALEACTDSASLAEIVPLPHEAALRRRVARAQGRLAEARALQLSGKPREALALARSLELEVETIPYAPLRAQAAFRAGDLLENTGDFTGAEAELHRALAFAEEGRDDLAKAGAWRKLAYTVGYRLSRFEEGLRQVELAKAALRRGGGDAVEEGAILKAEGGVLFAAGRLAEAAAAYRRAAALAEARGGADVSALANVATISHLVGDLETALAVGRRQLEAAEKTLGPGHPNVAALRFNLGGWLNDAGRLDEAHAEYQKALDLRRRLFGPEHVDVAESLCGLGASWTERGEPARALPLFERALAIYAREGAGSNYAAVAHQLYGEALGRLGRYAEGERQIERSIEIFGGASGAGGVYAGQAVLELAVLRIDRGAAAGALPLLARAGAILGRHRGDTFPWMPDLIRFRTAQARWEAGIDRSGSLRAAREAREALAAAGLGAFRQLAAADAWLAKRERGRVSKDG